MSKKTCFIIFIIAMIAILASYIFNFTPITKECNAIFAQMQNIYVALAAVIFALLLRKVKYYWLIILGLAIITAIVIQYFVMGASLTVFAVLYKALAFIIYVYLITLFRFML